MGARRSEWSRDHAGMEVEAELVSDRHAGPHDSSAGAASHGEACRRNGGGNSCESLALHLEAAGRSRADRKGGTRSDLHQVAITTLPAVQTVAVMRTATVVSATAGAVSVPIYSPGHGEW